MSTQRPPTGHVLSSTYEFLLIDVFTRHAYSGNQLAVLPDARGLRVEQMQAIAREFNFAETTFVLPPDQLDHCRRVRIFTPTAEMPFAGHPTIGTAAALVHLGLAGGSSDETSFVLEEIVGAVRVSVRRDQDSIFSRLTLEGDVAHADQDLTSAHAADVLGLTIDDVVQTFVAGFGPRFCFVRLRDAGAVDRAVLDKGAWGRHLRDAWAQHVFLFAGSTSPGSILYARMFAPALGIAEDPATGSASAILAGTLAASVVNTGGDGTLTWHVQQGHLLGRPSAIEASASCQGGRVVSISVGGHSVIHGRGCLEVPATVAGRSA